MSAGLAAGTKQIGAGEDAGRLRNDGKKGKIPPYWKQHRTAWVDLIASCYSRAAA